MASDPASDILTLARAQTILSGSLTAGGRWAIRFPAPERIKFSAIVKGSCWIALDGRKTPFRAEAGDVLLLAAKRSFVMSSEPGITPVPIASLVTGAPVEAMRIGKTDDFIQIGGHLELDASSGWLVSEVFPPWMHIKASSPQATSLRWILDELLRENRAALPGARIASAQLAQLMFVHILRAQLGATGSTAAGWPRLLAEPGLAAAVREMHATPARDWQLHQLARIAAMSRTTFALKFKTAAGVAPLTYLTQWRMRLAERSLRDDDVSISSLAESLGYASESAFSHAFKRVTGAAPRVFRSGRSNR